MNFSKIIPTVTIITFIVLSLTSCSEKKEEPNSVELTGLNTDNTANTVNTNFTSSDFPPIIWIGDSLTQGSLGDDNGNENNPQAPWRVLKEISGWNVKGYGYYGYNTHDILWAYGEYGGIKNPEYIYIFWVGSNDFYESPANISKVIEEIDKFIANVKIDKYLVLGTTNRGDMAPDAYKSINSEFDNKYGNNYLDIMPYIKYGPDNIHLTEESYKEVAEAVYDKLISLYSSR
ncbi:MAG: hypothetical protein K6E98_11805 [Lachnospiraceae bacterium]|nr:hypothetical protein [Lachnospiraceae bacterium]